MLNYIKKGWNRFSYPSDKEVEYTFLKPNDIEVKVTFDDALFEYTIASIDTGTYEHDLREKEQGKFVNSVDCIDKILTKAEQVCHNNKFKSAA